MLCPVSYKGQLFAKFVAFRRPFIYFLCRQKVSKKLVAPLVIKGRLKRVFLQLALLAQTSKNTFPFKPPFKANAKGRHEQQMPLPSSPSLAVRQTLGDDDNYKTKDKQPKRLLSNVCCLVLSFPSVVVGNLSFRKRKNTAKTDPRQKPSGMTTTTQAVGSETS